MTNDGTVIGNTKSYAIIATNDVIGITSTQMSGAVKEPVDLEAVTTIAEVAALYDLTLEAVRKALKNKRVRARRSGSTWLVDLASAKAYWSNRAESDK